MTTVSTNLEKTVAEFKIDALVERWNTVSKHISLFRSFKWFSERNTEPLLKGWNTSRVEKTKSAFVGAFSKDESTKGRKYVKDPISLGNTNRKGRLEALYDKVEEVLLDF